MNPVVVHKNNQTCEIKKCVSNVRKAKWLRKTRRCNLHLKRKQQKLSHENPNSLRVEKEISAVSAVAYSSFQSVKHTRVLHLPLNVISLIFPPLPPNVISLIFPPLPPHPFTLEQLVKFLQ